ncbi:MAG: hypothetical protein KF864_03765 [Phycisphaeraceae bacterium]|nr:hypothetical protein [Phycisphaeraceae bacterium]
MPRQTPLDGAATPATLEHQALLGESMPATVTYLAREYVWGPGDWGVDELLVQYDQGRRASWPLQDAGGDVIALCDLGGTSGSARVITQIVYDAYGRVIGRDDPATPATGPPELRVGHKGLFFDRLDGGIADPLTGFDLPRLWPGARLSGYVRNRTLHCDFGRWNQPDPNATGLPVQASLSYHGDGFEAYVQEFDLHGHFVDGPNVYAYLGAEPLGRADPMGLFFSFGEVLGASTWQAGLQSDYSQDALGYGKTITDAFYYQFADLADEQWLMAELATDWGVNDDLFGASMTAAGGGTLRFPGSVRGNVSMTGNSGYAIAGLESDHLIPRFAGGDDGADNLFDLAFKQHRGAGGKSRHGNLRALMHQAGIPVPTRGMDSVRWQAYMKAKCKTNPSIAQKFADALIDNATHVDKSAPGYLKKMKKSLKKFKPGWMPKKAKLKI